MEFVNLPDDVLVVGNAILLPPFRRDLLTYDRDVKEALGIFYIKKNSFLFCRINTTNTPRNKSHTKLNF